MFLSAVRLVFVSLFTDFEFNLGLAQSAFAAYHVHVYMNYIEPKCTVIILHFIPELRDTIRSKYH